MGVRFPPGAPRLRACHDAGTAMRDNAGMKRCGRCGETKSIDQFSFRKKAAGARHSICKVCHGVYRATYVARHGTAGLHARIYSHTVRYRERNRRFLNDYLSAHPCVDCGIADPIVLEFDHVSGSKRAALSAMAYSAATIETLRVEIAKCEVRCANCHRRRTAQSRGYWKHRQQGKHVGTPELSPVARGDCSSAG